MVIPRRSAIRRIAVVWTVALVLLPLALSGHRHATGQPAASDACTLCVATHYSPATLAAQLPQPAQSPATVAVDVPASAVLAHLYQPRPSGRAPPRSAFFHAV